ncbi:hypothetical protein SISNIDRAFT_489113 [Sistotremastrum niveocremeum HHB9708]|uniref:Uncharacterized protein n=1 Tax=Sistotremastrum niveocremeum HHB9708 TaxID=1314777 RepID=A0A164QIY3_9AGAM|nr:hypothetical protein SISNIDRAFT_489113 [Sistotremastrum niveocremeum HHB9708]
MSNTPFSNSMKIACPKPVRAMDPVMLQRLIDGHFTPFPYPVPFTPYPPSHLADQQHQPPNITPSTHIGDASATVTFVFEAGSYVGETAGQRGANKEVEGPQQFKWVGGPGMVIGYRFDVLFAHGDFHCSCSSFRHSESSQKKILEVDVSIRSVRKARFYAKSISLDNFVCV